MSDSVLNKIRYSKTGIFPVFRFLPNIVTLIGLCVALSSIKFAMESQFAQAAKYLIIAAFLDGIDGRLARFLNSDSPFGAQLDSIVDFANFAVVPGFVTYFWAIYNGEYYGFSWPLLLFFAICGAVRLARFNVDLVNQNHDSVLEKYFFKGIPAPLGAVSAMLPIILFNEYGINFYNDPMFIISYVGVIGVLMASTIPTISIKLIPLRNEYIFLTFVVLTSIVIGLLTVPWYTLAFIVAVYLGTIPFTIIAYMKIALSQSTQQNQFNQQNTVQQ